MTSAQLNGEQKRLLNDVLDPNDGWLMSPFFQTSMLSDVQKHTLLSLSLSQTVYDFIKTLDVLFQHFRLQTLCENNDTLFVEKAAWFVSLKRLNDLVHNNEMCDSQGNVKRAQYFYFRGLSIDSDLLNTDSALSNLLKTTMITMFNETLLSLSLSNEKTLKALVLFIDKQSGMQGDPSWRTLMPLPFDQVKGRPLYWFETFYHEGGHWWFQCEFFMTVLWETIEEIAAYTGCASSVEAYEERQHAIAHAI